MLEPKNKSFLRVLESRLTGCPAAHSIISGKGSHLPVGRCCVWRAGGGYRDPELQIDCLSGTGRRRWASRPPRRGESPFLRTSHPLFETDKVFFFSLPFPDLPWLSLFAASMFKISFKIKEESNSSLI